MTDLMQLIPHHKTDSKLDTKHDWNVINEVAELKVRRLSSWSVSFHAPEEYILYFEGDGFIFRIFCPSWHGNHAAARV